MAFRPYFIFSLALIALAGFLRALLPYKAPPGLLSDPKILNWVQPGRFTNHNGWSIFYRDSIGDALYSGSDPSLLVDRPVVLFLHGFPTFSYDFSALYKDLSTSGYYVVNLDFLGYGVSDKPSDIDYTLHLQADIVERVLNHVISERAHFGGRSLQKTPVRIVAHDMGDSVAQELLARWLESKTNSNLDISSVVLMNGGLFPETHKPRAAQLLLLSQVTGPVASRLFTFSIFSKSFNEVFGPNSKLNEEEMTLYWNSLLYKNGMYSMHLLQQYMTDRLRHRERWVGALVNSSQLIPIRLINGPYDPVSGKHMVKRYQELIPEAAQDVVVLGASVGHYPQLEDAASVRQHVIDFLEKK